VGFDEWHFSISQTLHALLIFTFIVRDDGFKWLITISPGGDAASQDGGMLSSSADQQLC
jgi:hypothetical protein